MNLLLTNISPYQLGNESFRAYPNVELRELRKKIQDFFYRYNNTTDIHERLRMAKEEYPRLNNRKRFLEYYLANVMI